MSSASNLVRLDSSALHAAPPVAAAMPSASSGELDAFRFPGEAARAVVSGSAGSGKTTLLHRIAGLLSSEDTSTAPLRETTDVGTMPPEVVLLVDDAHLLDQERITALSARAEDPDAGMVVALRSWPSRPDLVALTRLLERSRPIVLLGEVTHVRLRATTTGFGACDDDVLRLTGGVAWLVHECLAAHDERDCRDDPSHRVLQRAIRPRILHRMSSVSPGVRRLLEDLSLRVAPGTGAADDVAGDLIAEAYAEGLVTDDGRPAPAIAAAVRATTPFARIVDVIEHAPRAALRDDPLVATLDGLHDASAADVLVARARAEIHHDPELASALFERAISCGADPDPLALDRALSAWASGRLDDAGVLLDELQERPGTPGIEADLAAAVWAERGLMSLADDTYRSRQPDDMGAAIRMRIAAVAAGRADESGSPATKAPGSRRPPSALGVANELLDNGLTATLGDDPDAGVAALQRASELYTASADASPYVELPAVIAATAAIGVGDPKCAQTIVEDALHGGQGGASRRARLELWSSWVALQRERPADARAALARASATRPLTPRDDALAATITIGLARRYDDAAALAAEWDASRARVSRTEPDLFSLLSLSELVIAAARLGDAVSVQPAFDRALQIVAALGSPPIWSAPLHWAGIQRGILLNQPDALAPHARALVGAAPHNRLAARMAHAGKVWTSVLAGVVDADAVEGAARGLAVVGLAWDGARLAGHGASRSDDRKVMARLLACARELHPREPSHLDDEGQPTPLADAGDGSLSEREREVAELVLQGKTYVEIGAAIFISPRTAEHHIAHIRRRLNATSRSDLLSKLRIALDGVASMQLDSEPGGPRG